MQFDLYDLYNLICGLHSFPLELNCPGSKPTLDNCVSLATIFFPSLNFRIFFYRGNNNT